jgi:hypothetical protein
VSAGQQAPPTGGGPRWCAGCSARLASDNPTLLCAPCTRTHRDRYAAPPLLAAEWWAGERYRTVFATRHIGQVLRAYRTDPRWHPAFGPDGISQAVVASWAGVVQSHVSRLENGDPEKNIDKLTSWALLLHMPQELLWFALPHTNQDTATVPDSSPAALTMSLPVLAPMMSGGFGWFAGTTMSVVTASPDRVGMVEIEIIREMTSTYRTIDNKYGGGHARQLLVNFLDSSVRPWLWSAGGSNAELLIAAADLSHLAGWMAYDTGDGVIGSKHVRQAHALSTQAGDHARSAEMLAGLAHQAAHAGAGPVAVDLALAARDTAGRTGIGVLLAETSAMAAHGYAVGRDHTASRTALAEAEKTYEASENTDRPAWLDYFDRAYLAAKTAHVLALLGDLGQAESAARASLVMAEGFERGRLFNTALLANILAVQGKVDEAAAQTVTAVEMLEGMTSARSIKYLTGVAHKLAPFARNPAAQQALEQLRTAGVPLVSQQD